MNILIATSEVVPFAKTGGLADVCGALPESFAQKGHLVKVFLPKYQSAQKYFDKMQQLDIKQNIHINGSVYELTCYSLKHKKLPLEFIFIANDILFDRPELYMDRATGKDYEDNDDRFIFFNLAVLEVAKALSFKPDIAHVHDWQAALIPAYLKLNYLNDAFFQNCKSVLTIHNLAFHGMFPNKSFTKLNLSQTLFYPTSPFEFYGKVNFLKAAIAYTDKITTVSKTYAKEIQTKEFGCGLDGVLRERSDDIIGILNGVDYKIWSPTRDSEIAHFFRVQNLSGKKMNKIELLNYAKLPIRDKTPLIGIISRLSDQKGFDLIKEISDDLFNLDIQFILLGTGDDKYHKLFTELEKKYPDKCKAFLKFDNSLAHKIEAGADMFLMPSKYEPCGLNQIYSLKYGTIPIVRKVGGLADTVLPYDNNDETGTGFLFESYDSDEFLQTIKTAVNLFKVRRKWTKLMKNAMASDFSWDKSAEQYVQLFESLLSRKHEKTV